MQFGRLACKRMWRISSIVTVGMVLQMGGCGVSLDTLVPTFVSAFTGLAFNSFFTGLFGVGF